MLGSSGLFSSRLPLNKESINKIESRFYFRVKTKKRIASEREKHFGPKLTFLGAAVFDTLSAVQTWAKKRWMTSGQLTFCLTPLETNKYKVHDKHLWDVIVEVTTENSEVTFALSN